MSIAIPTLPSRPTIPRSLPPADLVVAIAVTALLMVATVTTAAVGPMARTGAAVIGLGLLSLAGRRQQPLPAAVATVVVVITSVLSAPDAVKAPVLLALSLVVYAVVRYESGARLMSGMLVCIGGVAIARLVLPAEHAHGVTVAQLEVVLVLFPALGAALIRLRGQLPGLLEPALVSKPVPDAGSRSEVRGPAERSANLGHGLRRIDSWIEFGRVHRDRLFSVVAAGLVGLVLVLNGVDTEQVVRAIAVLGLAVIAVGSVALVGRWPWPALSVGLAAAVAFSGFAARPDAYNSVIAGLVVIGLPLMLGWMLRQGQALIALGACTAAVIVMGVAARAAALGAAATAVTGQEVLSSVALAVGAWSAGRVLRGGCRVVRTAGRATTTAPPSERTAQLLPDAAELVRRAELLGLRPTAVEVEPPTIVETLPAAVGRVAQEVLDEALANVALHAPGAELMIRIVDQRAAIRIEVINGPAVGGTGAGAGPGRGVPALATQIAALGGMFCVGPSAGGFALRARLPVEEPR